MSNATIPNGDMNRDIDALLRHIDDAVDASDDALNVLVPCTVKAYDSSVVDAAIAEYVDHGWSVYFGRKAGTWLRLERRSYSARTGGAS